MSAFDSLADYVAVPRLTGLRLSPDGARLVAAVQAVSADGKRYLTSLWDVDPDGSRDAVRLTRTGNVTGFALRPDRSVLFAAVRPDDEAGPEASDDADGDEPALWLLPPGPGEPRRVATRAGGYGAPVVAADAGTVVVASDVLPGATDADDTERRRRRRDLDVRAILHERSPVRYWDRDLGPGEPHLLVVDVDVDVAAAGDTGAGQLRDLTPDAGPALREQQPDVSRDGRTAVVAWQVETEPGLTHGRLVVIDAATGERATIAAEDGVSFHSPALSPDATQVVCVRETDGSYDEPPRLDLCVVDVATGERRLLGPRGQWPAGPRFGADGREVFHTADEDGHHPVFAVDVVTGERRRVAAGGHFSDLCVAPDGRTLFALRDRVDAPPVPVRLDAAGVDQEGVPLPAPGRVEVPGRLEQVRTTAADGHPLRAWLVLPAGASEADPAPLLLWVHGGPLSSWNGWSWRWNPWLAAARGYAVLLPDPALSTGYGEAMLRRGWGQWGGAPYEDLMALTDAALERADLDRDRTAAMGGSYGGYMANWIAGHTDRFRCIVTHASLWHLEGFVGTTDLPAYWVKEWGAADVAPERYEKWSPNRYADSIRTPMLVVHGDRDYRVPIGEGLALWWDLQRRGVPSKFLYYPNENHWVLSPGGATVWYETVFAWLAHWVLGEEWRRPELV